MKRKKENSNNNIHIDSDVLDTNLFRRLFSDFVVIFFHSKKIDFKREGEMETKSFNVNLKDDQKRNILIFSCCSSEMALEQQQHER